MSVTEPHEKAVANAALIVRAINAHDALVEVAKEAAAFLREEYGPFAGETTHFMEAVGKLCGRIDAALSLARTEPTIGASP